MNKKIEVDWDKCIGNGMCAALAGSYFEIDNEGNLVLLQDVVHDGDLPDVDSAVVSCPVGAIQVKEVEHQ